MPVLTLSMATAMYIILISQYEFSVDRSLKFVNVVVKCLKIIPIKNVLQSEYNGEKDKKKVFIITKKEFNQLNFRCIFQKKHGKLLSSLHISLYTLFCVRNRHHNLQCEGGFFFFFTNIDRLHIIIQDSVLSMCGNVVVSTATFE